MLYSLKSRVEKFVISSLCQLFWNLWNFEISGEFDTSIWSIWKVLLRITSPMWWRQTYQRRALSKFAWIDTQAAERWPVLAEVVSKQRLTIFCKHPQELSKSKVWLAIISPVALSLPVWYFATPSSFVPEEYPTRIGNLSSFALEGVKVETCFPSQWRVALSGGMHFSQISFQQPHEWIFLRLSKLC